MFYLNFAVCMTHYYFYIETGKMLDASAKFFKVTIGQSKVETRVLNQLQRYAADHGHYFAMADEKATRFWYRCLNSIGHLATSQVYIRGRELLRHLRSAELPQLDPNLLHNRHQMSLTLNLDYRISSRIAANR